MNGKYFITVLNWVINNLPTQQFRSFSSCYFPLFLFHLIFIERFLMFEWLFIHCKLKNTKRVQQSFKYRRVRMWNEAFATWKIYLKLCSRFQWILFIKINSKWFGKSRKKGCRCKRHEQSYYIGVRRDEWNEKK